MDHVVQVRHFLVGIREDREVHFGVLGFLDVTDPLMVGIERVHADRNGLDAALVEFGLQLGGVAQFGGANRREVLRVREQHNPVVAGPLVEIDGSLG